MQCNFEYFHKKYTFQANEPLDISLPLKNGTNNVNCYFAEEVRFETIRQGNFVGSVREGGSVNYQKITFTPHGNGTHTECIGHISNDAQHTITNCLKKFLFFAELVSIEPKQVGEDKIILLDDLQAKIKHRNLEALIIRTLPNLDSKKNYQYSNTNPPYLEAKIADFLIDLGVKHLLVDLPSVDKEIDEGALKMHKSFWQFPTNERKDCTITELIFIENTILDGVYLLNLQVANFDTDASPSRPLIFALNLST